MSPYPGSCKYFNYSCRDFRTNPISLDESNTVGLCKKKFFFFSTEKGNDLFIYLCAVDSHPRAKKVGADSSHYRRKHSFFVSYKASQLLQRVGGCSFNGIWV